MTVVKIKCLNTKAIFPKRKTPGAAAFDVYTCINESISLQPGALYKIPLGFALEIPSGWMGLILPRSSASLSGISVEHPPIDSDYRGEIHLLIRYYNTHKLESYVLHPNTRIAQLLFIPCFMGDFTIVDELSNTVRDEGAFGSTGQDL